MNFPLMFIYLVTSNLMGFSSGLPNVVQQDPGLLETISEAIGDPCPNGWDDFENHCYLVSSSIKSWSQAQTYCHGQGGELVKITGAKENDFVLDLVRKNAPSVKAVWLGLQWNAGLKKFMWSDYSLPVYTNWAPNEPNGNGDEQCSNMWIKHAGVAGFWNDFTCHISTFHPCGSVCKKLR